MTWLHVGMLAGLAGIALPVLIHLLARGKPQPLVFPALRLIRPAVTRQAKGWRVRRWLLLTLRMLAVTLLTLLLAGPMLNVPAAPGSKTGALDVVLVVDDSASMSAKVGGEMLWDHAVGAAREFIASLAPGSRVGLLTPSGQAWADFSDDVPPGVLPPRPLTPDIHAVQSYLPRLRVQQHGEPLWPAIHAAGEWLADRPGDTKNNGKNHQFIVVLSDFAGPALEGAEANLPDGVQMVWGRIRSPDEPFSGILSVEAPKWVMPETVSVSLSAEVNLTRPASSAALKWFLDEKLQLPVKVPSGPSGKPQTVALHVGRLPAGLHALRLECVPGEDGEKNKERFVALEIGSLPVIGLVTPDGKPPADAQSVAFLTATALVPPRLPPERQRQTLRFLTPAQLMGDKLREVSLLILADPPLLSVAQIQGVQGFVKAGGHLLTVPGPSFLSAATQAANAAVFAPYTAITTSGLWRLKPDSFSDPLLQPFAEGRPSLAGPCFERIYTVATSRPESAVILRFDQGQPAIFRSPGPAPRGSETVLAFSPQSADGNLAQVGQAGTWVVLLNRLAELSRPASHRTENVPVGQVVPIPPSLVEGTGGRFLLWPDGSRHKLHPSPDGSTAFRVMQAGFYRVEDEQRMLVLVASNVPRGETDRKTKDSQNLLKLYGPERSQVVNNLSEMRQTGGAAIVQKPLADELAILLLAVLLVESFLANRFYGVGTK